MALSCFSVAAAFEGEEAAFGMLPPLLLASPGGFLAAVTFVRPFAVAEGTDPVVRFAVVVEAAGQCYD